MKLYEIIIKLIRDTFFSTIKKKMFGIKLYIIFQPMLFKFLNC